MKKNSKLLLTLIIAVMIFIPFIRVNAAEEEAIGTTSATIKGTNYEIDTDNKKVILDSNANVELSGNAEEYFIDVKENATNVTITLNNYSATTGGWVNAINLNNKSSIKVVLVGDNTLESGQEASAIRVPEGTSLVIEGTGKLTAKVSNSSSAASSAVIGSQYDLDCGDITINSGTIVTQYSGGGTASGIGTGDWTFNTGDIEGNITINGGNITTKVLGSATGAGVMNIAGSGSAIIYTETLAGIITDYNGIIFVTGLKNGEVRGNATLAENLTIPSDYSFTVAPEATLTIPENVTLTNNGTMDVIGAILNYGSIQNAGTFTNNGSINSDTEIEGATGNEIVPATYECLDGADLNYVKDETTEATFRINADYSLFQTGGKVYVNDSLLDGEKYTSKAGSTIINLNNQYMNTLSAGNYTLKVVFNNNAISTANFTVTNQVVTQSTPESTSTVEEEPTSTVENPPTYDNISVYFSIFGLSALCLAGMYTKRKFSN